MNTETTSLIRIPSDLAPLVATRPRRKNRWVAALLVASLLAAAGWSVRQIQAWQEQEALQWEITMAHQAEQHQREMEALRAALAELTETSRRQAEALQTLAANPPMTTVHYLPAPVATPRRERVVAPAPVVPSTTHEAKQSLPPVADQSTPKPEEAQAVATAVAPGGTERQKLELRAEMLEPETEKPAKPNYSVRKFLRSSLFIDSAVLAGSLLVPPSVPLALAQSRLGRRLTGKVIKKTNQDGTVAAKVAKDLGDMPVTQRRRR